MRALYWLRKDLRLEANPVIGWLVEQGAEVVLLAVEDPVDPVAGSRAKKERRHLLEGMDQSLGGKIHLETGDSWAVLQRYMADYGCDRLVFQRQYEPWEVNLERRIAQASIPCEIFRGFMLVDPEQGVKQDGSVYQVFRPYFEHWLTQAKSRSEASDWRALKAIRVNGNRPLPEIAQGPGPERAERFFEGGLSLYGRDRDIPSLDGTSQLSHLINQGAVPIDWVYERAMGEEDYIRQLAWRDYYLTWLYQHPECVVENHRAVWIDWADDPVLFEAWKRGETGYDLVDAAMRQLAWEGWINGRLRMLCASFLVKDLHIDWRWGERYFREQLIDADLALNVGNWQYMAGTGALAQMPYRVISPETHLRRFDRNRTYVERYDLGERPRIVDHDAASKIYREIYKKKDEL